MKEMIQPLVSIGVPVFNGEKRLSHALDYLLEQDYSNLEIIISDNGSTDSTPDICAEYACRDSRIKTYRVEINHGVIWNYRHVFELSSGKYFMWAADDDIREPSFVSACVEKLEQCLGAVLCQSHTDIFIEGREEMLCEYNLNSFENATGLVGRYRETLKHIPATTIYGLYRVSGVHKTQLYHNVIATDLAFLQELSIHGAFVQIPKVLFHYSGREKWNTIDEDYRVFFGKEKKPWWYLPFVVLFIDHWKRVLQADLPFGAKIRLWGVLIEHEAGQVALKLLIKIAGRLCPEKWKEKLGCAIYWQWMHNPNREVGCNDLYLERAIKPMLGWWR